MVCIGVSLWLDYFFRSPASCFFHYQQCLNPHIAKTHFTEEADRRLSDAAIECGLSNWTLVACLLGPSLRDVLHRLPDATPTALRQLTPKAWAARELATL